jgi:Inorganic H+ pyrophosphatase
VFFLRTWQRVLAMPRGNTRMVEIADAIQQGAAAFLRQEYRWLAVFVGVVAVLMGIGMQVGARLLTWGHRPSQLSVCLWTCRRGGAASTQAGLLDPGCASGPAHVTQGARANGRGAPEGRAVIGCAGLHDGVVLRGGGGCFGADRLGGHGDGGARQREDRRRRRPRPQPGAQGRVRHRRGLDRLSVFVSVYLSASTQRPASCPTQVRARQSALLPAHV